MKLLTELINIRRIDDEEPAEDEILDDRLEGDEDDDMVFRDDPDAEGGDRDDDPAGMDDMAGLDGGEDLDGQSDELDGEGGQGDDQMMDADDAGEDIGDGLDGNGQEPTDPDRAGTLRTVKGAHLVYKREMDDGTYEEMWIYNSGEFKRDIETRKAILAGTDIPQNATTSPDGSQEVEFWSAGNADIVRITGLPN